jgi:hypothetical protein
VAEQETIQVAQEDRTVNPHIFFLGAIEASRLVAREAHSADPGAPIARLDARATASKPPAGDPAQARDRADPDRPSVAGTGPDSGGHR